MCHVVGRRRHLGSNVFLEVVLVPRNSLVRVCVALRGPAVKMAGKKGQAKVQAKSDMDNTPTETQTKGARL